MSVYEHLEALSVRTNALTRTYKARDATGNLVIVKEFFTSAFVDTGIDDLRSGVNALLPQLQSLREFPGGVGTAPWLDMEDEGKVLRIVRPFYPMRLVDQFPPDPHNPPTVSLLQAFRSMAEGIDQLSQYFPDMSFFICPGDLLGDGVTAVVADYGLVNLFNAIEGAYIGPRLLGKDFFRWCNEAASCYPLGSPTALINQLPGNIKPVFALASLYFYLRTGHGPFMVGMPSTALEGTLRAFMPFWSANYRAEAYFRNGTLELDGLELEAERRILAQALDVKSLVKSCSELIDELSTLG